MSNTIYKINYLADNATVIQYVGTKNYGKIISSGFFWVELVEDSVNTV